MNKIFSNILPDGFKYVLVPSNSEITYISLVINAGSRNENNNQQGIAHFIEHILFKGTKKRNSFHILNRIDSVGGEINAYTSKEETCIYITIQNIYLERALELLNDIIQNSSFPEKELKKEKEVILDEILSYEDNPSDLIMDEFDEIVFPNHPLGKNILGTQETVKSFNKKKVLEYFNSFYTPFNMALSIIGNHDFSSSKKLIETYFSFKATNKKNEFLKFSPSKKNIRIVKSKDIQQDHLVMGTYAPSLKSKDRIATILLNNYFGGPAMNTRLNLAIREKHGLTYNIESSYSSYQDIGLFSIYFATDKKNFEKTLYLVNKELKLLREKKLGIVQLSNAKKQLKGNIALSQENKVGLAAGLAKSFLTFNKIDELKEVYKKIDDVSSEQILELSNKIMDENKFSSLHFQSKK
jgi:predicted Zn-dependent peptidase